MRKLASIMLLCFATSAFCQQVTFADILNAEPEVKYEKSKALRADSQNKTKQKSYQGYYSPLRTLNRTFFESYLSIIGNIGILSYPTSDYYEYSNEVRRNTYGFGLEYELGARLSPIIFLGAGIGARTYIPENKENYNTLNSWGFNMPLFAITKIYMLSNYDFSMSADFGLGGCFNIKKSNMTPYGMLLRVGLGGDIRRFTLAAGYEMLANLGGYTSLGHLGYLKLGVIISK